MRFASRFYIPPIPFRSPITGAELKRLREEGGLTVAQVSEFYGRTGRPSSRIVEVERMAVVPPKYSSPYLAAFEAAKLFFRSRRRRTRKEGPAAAEPKVFENLTIDKALGR